MKSFTTASFNTCTGVASMNAITTGSCNSSCGYNSFYILTSGNNNTGIGQESLLNLTTGNNNSCVGYQSGKNLSSGTNNTCIGFQSGINLSTSNSNNICINNGGVAGESNKIRIGNDNSSVDRRTFIAGVYGAVIGAINGIMYCDDLGQIGAQPSSLRYKDNVVDMEDTSYFYNLRPVNFTYKTDNTNRKQYGFIAEEVEQVNPSFIRYGPDHNDMYPDPNELCPDYTDMYADLNDLDPDVLDADGNPTPRMKPTMKPKMKPRIKADGLNEMPMLMSGLHCIIEQKKEINELKQAVLALQQAVATLQQQNIVTFSSSVPETVEKDHLTFYEKFDMNLNRMALFCNYKTEGALQIIPI
jgi:hypothetical protein